MEDNNNLNIVDRLIKICENIYLKIKILFLEILCTLVFIYFVHYVQEIMTWFVENNTLIKSLTIYSNKTVFLKLITFLIISFISIIYIVHIYRSKSTWVRMLIHLYAWIIVFVSYSNAWTVICCGLSYQPFFYMVALVSFVIDLAFVVDDMLKDEIKKSIDSIADIRIDNYSGFVVTTKEENYEKTGSEDLSKILLARLYKTDISKENYAVGIVGEWGAGKTTFLKNMKKYIDGEFVIFDFNPWDIKSPDRIVSEFFNSFIELFSEKEKETKQLLLDYLALLNSVASIPYTDKIKAFLDISTNRSLVNKKHSIIEKLKTSGKKYLVCVDDIDRLDGLELFEVLRLIRNTANFPSLYFIVTYDKNYVIERLKRIGLESSEQYLKKIFNMEIVLPSYEPYVLPRLFLKDLFSTLHNEEVKRYIIKEVRRLDQLNNYIITNYIQNFRDAKRFSTILSLHIDVFLLSHKLVDISFHDLFWVEVLSYYDEKIYEQLRTNRLSILNINAGGVYSLKNNYDEELVSCGVEFKQGTKFILNELFAKKEIDNYDACIKNEANYFNYFSYRILDNVIGTEEFNSALNSESIDELYQIVMGWCEDDKRKKKNSFVQRLTSYEPILHNLNENKNYISMLVSSVQYVGDKTFGLFSTKLRYSNFNEEQITELGLFLNDILAFEVSTTNIRPFWNRVFASMHTEIQYYGDDASYKKRTILDNDNLSDLASKNFRMFLIVLKKPDPVEISNGDSQLGKFVREAVIITSIDESYGNNYGGISRLSLIDRELVGSYRNYNSKKLEEFISNFDFSDEYCSTPPVEVLKSNIEETFGTLSSFKEFVNDSFVKDETYIHNYYERIGI